MPAVAEKKEYVTVRSSDRTVMDALGLTVKIDEWCPASPYSTVCSTEADAETLSLLIHEAGFYVYRE